MFEGAAHDHDGVVEGAFRLLEELFRATSQDDGARLSLRAAHEQVESVMGEKRGNDDGFALGRHGKIHK